MENDATRRYFALQAEWTRQARNYLYRRANLTHAGWVLDVGCGDGSLAAEVAGRVRGKVVGVDLSLDGLVRAGSEFSAVKFCQADALKLPFRDAVFDVVLCHFFLMWVAEPAEAVKEMARVVKDGGFVIACAEPDYAGLIEEPFDCITKEFVIESLCSDGADPFVGRKLSDIFRCAHLLCETGELTKRFSSKELADSFELRWQMFRGRDPESKEKLKMAEQCAIDAGIRSYKLPVYWCFGRKSWRLI